MSNLHVLESVGQNTYRIIVHIPIPVANNSAGILYSTALVNARANTTRMPIGNGAGQITVSEAASIANGSIYEAEFQFTDDPAANDTSRTTRLDFEVTKLSAEVIAMLAAKFLYFGTTR